MITFKKQTLLLSACATLFLGACSGEHDSLGTGHLLQEANSDLSQKPEQQKALTPSGDFARYTGSLREAELVKSNILSFIDLLYPTSALDDAPFTQTSDRMSGEVSGLLKHQKAIIQAVLAQLSDSSESGPDAAVYDFKHCSYQGSARQSDTTNPASGITINIPAKKLFIKY